MPSLISSRKRPRDCILYPEPPSDVTRAKRRRGSLFVSISYPATTSHVNDDVVPSRARTGHYIVGCSRKLECAHTETEKDDVTIVCGPALVCNISTTVAEYPFLAYLGSEHAPIAVVDSVLAPNISAVLQKETRAVFPAHKWLSLPATNIGDYIVVVLMEHGHISRVWCYNKCNYEYSERGATVYSTCKTSTR